MHKRLIQLLRPHVFGTLLGIALPLAGLRAQNIGIGTTTPHASAVLDLSSSSKGLLFPRLTQAQRNAIASPATGLTIYQTDNTPGLYTYNGTAWLSSSGADNLGDHTATQNLNLGSNRLTGGGSLGLGVSSAGYVGIGSGPFTSQLSLGTSGSTANSPLGRIANYEDTNGNFFYGTGLISNGSSYGLGLWGGTGFNAPFDGVAGSPATLTVMDNGRVGIGTMSPAQVLDVNGTVRSRAGGFEFPDGTIQTTAATAPAAQTLSLSGQTLSLSGGNSVTLPVGADNLGNHTATTNLNLGSNLLTGGGSSGLRVDGTGQVGIGTSTPTQALDVNGTIRTRSGGIQFPDNTIQATAATNQSLSITGQTLSISGGNSITLPTGADNLGNHTATQNLNLGSNRLTGGGSGGLSVAGNGYVGIGTGPFTSQFSLGKSGSVANTPLGRMANYEDGGQYFYGSGLIFNGSNYGLGLWGGTGTSAPWDGAAGTQPHLTLESTGRVGIGTMAPTQALDVSGTIRSRSGGVQFPDNTVQTTAATNQSLSISGQTLSISGGNSITLPVAADNLGNHTATQNLNLAANQLVGNGGTSGLSISNGGSVGIGTTTPHASAALDVNSTSKGLLFPRLTQAQRDAIASPAAGLTIYQTDNVPGLYTFDGWVWTSVISSGGFNSLPTAGAVTFNYTGGEQTYTVPAGVTALYVTATGGSGGTAYYYYPSSPAVTAPGGLGGRIRGWVPVTPGEVLTIRVGGSSNGTSAGYNGGGSSSGNSGFFVGGGGGGATDLRRNGTRTDDPLAARNALLIAAGGGGAAITGPNQSNKVPGGNGGGLVGGNGSCGVGGTTAGGGGTQSAPGGSGAGLGQGASTFVATAAAGGAGGGGFYGGGAGGNGSCSGGGGSSWASSLASGVEWLGPAGGAGNGQLTIIPATSFPAPFLNGANIANVPGDNLGNHTATKDLNLGSNLLTGGGSSGLRVDASGNVGLGTSAPAYRLDVQGPASNNVVARLGSASTTGPTLLFDGPSRQFSLLSTGATAGAGPNKFGLVDETANAYRWVVDADGDLGVGTTSPAFRLDVQAPSGDYNAARLNSNSVVGTALRFDNSTGRNFSLLATGSGNTVGGGKLAIYDETPMTGGYRWWVDGATGNMMVSGSVSFCGGAFTCSDRRYKKDITPLQGALQNVLRMNGYTYFWRRDEFKDRNFTADKQLGFIAQEVEQLYPEMVQTDPQTGYKSVDYAKLTPVLVEAVKEMHAKLDAQPQRADRAEATLESFEARLRTLEAGQSGQARR